LPVAVPRISLDAENHQQGACSQGLKQGRRNQAGEDFVPDTRHVGLTAPAPSRKQERHFWQAPCFSALARHRPARLPFAWHSVGFLMIFTILCAVNVMAASVHSLQATALNNLIRYWNSQGTTVSIQCYRSCVMSAESFECECILLFSCSSNLVLLLIM